MKIFQITNAASAEMVNNNMIQAHYLLQKKSCMTIVLVALVKIYLSDTGPVYWYRISANKTAFANLSGQSTSKVFFSNKDNFNIDKASNVEKPRNVDHF